MCINKSLSVEGLLHEKERLEGSVAQCVASLLHEFAGRTGLSIRSVDVEMVEVSAVEGRKAYRVAGVTVTTNLI